MSPWEGIQEFIMVVETGGFTAAAKRLGVSSAHVSRQVARLEDRINVKLLARSTRAVRLTDGGAEYHRKVANLTAGIEEANETAAGADAQLGGRIRVTAAGTFAEELVAPVLARFVLDHPGVSIEMDFTSRFVDLVDQGFDFAIRYGVLTDSGLIARRLSLRTIVCAASPDYLTKHGVPQHPRELRSQDCLITNSDRWQFNDPDTDTAFEVRVNGPWRANSGHAVCHAGVEGLGVVYAPSVNLRASLERKHLVPILEEFRDRTRSSWIVYPERRHMPIRVRKAIDYLIAAFAE